MVVGAIEELNLFQVWEMLVPDWHLSSCDCPVDAYGSLILLCNCFLFFSDVMLEPS
jgi:hypothetical protein